MPRRYLVGTGSRTLIYPLLKQTKREVFLQFV